ncbi:hypothetical protein HAX54_048473 [Datura stramonium]|uniref:Uncharacterized protein n=1 Tax=Datura stramonium TaxID=4076 RepID=A0ABS8RS15_DATST|nr:hypothetical protein [Datura stramonium]
MNEKRSGNGGSSMKCRCQFRNYHPISVTTSVPRKGAMNHDSLAEHRIMSTSQQCGKGKTPITDATTLGAESNKETLIDQLLFGINKMNVLWYVLVSFPPRTQLKFPLRLSSWWHAS